VTAPGKSGVTGVPGGTAVRRVAAIDCGTNSLRLLIADLSPDRGELTDVTRQMEIVRLGQGVDATGRLAPDALDRTFGVLAQYAALIRESGAAAVRMVATSATRDASNAAAFTVGVTAILGLPPEVITGAQEARLSFAGATGELAGQPEFRPPYLVVDIGGGSTEFVAGSPGDPHLRVLSTDIGCVRLTERHLHDDPPSAAQVAAATADIDAAIDAAAAAVLNEPVPDAPVLDDPVFDGPVPDASVPDASVPDAPVPDASVPDVPAGPAAPVATLVGLAGSVTTVTAIALGLASYDPERVHHARIPAARVGEVTRQLLAQTRAQRAALGPMHPGRVDVIGAGALILDRILTRLRLPDVVASEHDILDGIAWSLAGPRD
jgi:exopolyphosphatase/guanosine-5'-triphosphate,3'-diphosphate pyrophosphatase